MRPDPSTGKGYVNYKMQTGGGSSSGGGSGGGGNNDDPTWIIGLIVFGIIFLFSKELALLIFIIFLVVLFISIIFD